MRNELLSSVEELKSVVFRPFPTRAVSPDKVVRYGHELMALGKSGIVYTTSSALYSRGFFPRTVHYGDFMLWGNCLERLGILSEERYSEIQTKLMKETRLKDATYEYRKTLKYFKDLGLKLTQDQRDVIRKDCGLEKSNNDSDQRIS